MRVQTNRKLEQTAIKKFKKKYNVQIFSARMCEGEAFSTEQKIRELKRLLFKFKALDSSHKQQTT